ncbi:MAG TPA: hypothetical protein VFS23_01275 [Vicinamibacterales bacterium]|nr:hypothetical protein [Vicinamibacterales bacterium]
MPRKTLGVDDEALRVVGVVAMRKQLQALAPLQREVVSMLYGIGCRATPASEIVETLRLRSIEDLWGIHATALQELGAQIALAAAA